MKPFLLSSLLLFGFIKGSYCQLESNWWFFGENAGIEFSGGSPVPAFGGAIISDQGTASISNPITGDLLFYTDGMTVYDASHNPMPNGSGLLGSSYSAQAALIVPKPESNKLFYIFTTDAIEHGGNHGFRYSIVNINLNGGMGDVTSEKNELLFAPSSEQISAVKHANCIDWWIMAKEFSSNTYKAYLLTSSGLSAPVENIIELTDELLAFGQAKFAPNGTKYAIARGQLTQLFDFNNLTGVLSNLINLTIEDLEIVHYCYGLSFSTDNTKIYVTRGYFASELYQYDISSGSDSIILASATLIDYTSGENQLQLARDSKVYIASYGGNLSVINNPNLTGIACNLSVQTVTTSGASRIGLCNFPDSYFNETSTCSFNITANYDPISCNGANDATAWVGTSNGIPPFIYSWSPGGSTNDTIFDLEPGTYVITVTDSISLEVIDSVTITEPDLLTVSIGYENDSICNGTAFSFNSYVNGGTLPYYYLWSSSNNDTLSTNTLVMNTSGPIEIEVTDKNNCAANDSIYITVIAPLIISSSADTCICIGTSALVSASGVPNYLWNTGDTTSSFVVTPNSTTTYIVYYSDGICDVSDTTIVCVNPNPSVIASEDTSMAHNSSVMIQAEGDGPFYWSPSNSLSCNPCINPIASPEISTTYIVTVTNEFGCSAQDTVNVEVYYYVVIIPNVITPNSDDLNDVFEIVDLPERSSLTIFNRWGNELYTTQSYQNDWANTTDGVYYYILYTPDGKFYNGSFQVNGN